MVPFDSVYHHSSNSFEATVLTLAFPIATLGDQSSTKSLQSITCRYRIN